MAGIPTIPGTAQVADTQIGSKVNVQPRLRALGQVRQTAAEANSAIQGGIEIIDAYEQRKRKAEEAGFFNQSSITLMKATSDFRANIKKMPDADIVSNWTKASSAVKQTVADDPSFAKMSPLAQRKLKAFLDKWQGQSSGEFQLVADRLGSQRRHATAIAASREFLKSGDPGLVKNAEASLDVAVKVGDMTPEQADAYKEQFPGILQANQIRIGIGSHPVQTLHDIDDGKFSDVIQTTKLTLRSQAEAAVKRDKVAAYQDIRTQQAKGRIYTKQELTDLADSEKIDGGSISTILKAQKGDVTEDENLVAASNVHHEINKIPSNASPDQRLDAVVKIHGSKDYQSLTEQQKKDFDAALKPTKEPGTPPPQEKESVEQLRRESAAAVNSREAIDRRGGSYVLPDDEITARGGDPKDRIGFAESQKVIAAKQEGELRQWFKDYAAAHQNKPPAPEEVSAERMRILKPSVTDMVKQALSKPPTE